MITNFLQLRLTWEKCLLNYSRNYHKIFYDKDPFIFLMKMRSNQKMLIIALLLFWKTAIMKYCLAIILANIAIAFAGRLPLPESLQDQWNFAMKDDKVDLGRIVGGTPCVDGERPYQIGLYGRNSFICSESNIFNSIWRLRINLW